VLMWVLVAGRQGTSAVSPTRRTLRALQATLLYFLFPERKDASHVALVSVGPRNRYKEARREVSPRARRNRRRTSPHSACPQGRGFPCRCSSPQPPLRFHHALRACASLPSTFIRSPRRRGRAARAAPPTEVPSRC